MRISDWSSDVCSSDLTSEEELIAIGDEGVLALVCDSTNVFNHQASGSEGAVHRGLMEEVAKHTGRRVVVTTFASNVARLQTRSEEHTSELQSLMRISYAVFCLKKKTQKKIENTK